MRAVIRLAGVILLMLGPLAPLPWPAFAANLEPIADHVVGQPDFTHNIYNNGTLSAKSLGGPYRVALNAHGDLFVADTGNNRVLEFDAPLGANPTASKVFGQPDFTHSAVNNGNASPSAKSLDTPTGVALDAQGNLYVADAFNNRVLEYDAPLTSGMAASHVVGQGGSFTSAMVNNGGLSDSSLNGPFSVATDARGDLFVADYLNHRVLEYDDPIGDPRANQVYGQPDDTSNTANNGGLSAASLDGPIGVTLDGQGNLYVADHYNNRVLEYDSALTSDLVADRVFGQPTFFTNTVNNFGLSATSLSGPVDVALDARGSLYVADTSNNRVLEYNTPLSSATANRVFGQPDFTHGAANNPSLGASSLSLPQGVALDAQDNLYVADYGNNRVLEYDVPVPYGVPALTALSPSTVAAGGPAFELTVNGSGFVAYSDVYWNSSLHITTFINSTQLTISVSLADLAGGGPFPVRVFTPLLPGGGTSNQLNLSLYPRAGHDATADVVQGQPNFSAGAQNNLLLPGANRLNNPNGVAVDKHSGRLFVADTYNNRVLSWPNAPAFANAQPPDLVLGQPNFLAHTGNNGGVSARSLSQPNQVALDANGAQGNLYVADTNNNRVLEYDAPLSSGMAASRVFGQGGNFTTAVFNNGGVSANSLERPTSLALDAQGNLYVADAGNNRVLEYDTPLSTDTTADRVFGQPDFNQGIFNNGGLGAASLGNPNGVALDAQGNLYVADLANQRVLEYDAPLSSGMAASRVFGQPDFGHNDINHGGLSANSLSFPAGVALDAQANLYVADLGNSRVLEYDWALFNLRLPLVVR